jgi:hypothetical protein
MRGSYLLAAAALSMAAAFPATHAAPMPDPGWPPQKFRQGRGGKGKHNGPPAFGKHKGSKRAKKASRKGGNPSKA